MNTGEYKKPALLLIFVLVLSILYLTLNTENSTIEKNDAVEIYDSAVLGGQYLINSLKSDGSFVYEYDALNNTESTSYNILRHAGTIYSMLQLYEFTKNPELLQSSEKAIDYLLNHKKVFFEEKYVIVENDEIKLGGNALSIIALAEYTKVTGNDKYLTDMQELASFINYSQKESGEFICKIYYSSGVIDSFVSQYYPGEAILCLCRLYSIDNNESWLDIAEKAAKYLINIRDADISTLYLTHDHWLMMALNELYRYRADPLYYNHTLRIAESIMHLQRDNINRNAEYDEWLGSYYTPPSSTSTACRTEGLVAAYHLASDFGDNDTAKRILNAIKIGIDFQMKTQLTENNIKDLSNPKQALGGFTNYLKDYKIRIDYVQHNVCSILGLYKILNH